MPDVNYFWDEIEDNVVREYDENNNTIANYTTEPTLYGAVLTQDRNGEIRHYHYDGQGNMTELTDNAGNVTDTRQYTAFGELVARSGTTVSPFGFIGQLGYYTSPDSTSPYVRYRQLATEDGRWLSVDPVSINGHEFRLLQRSQSTGFSEVSYTYVNGNPINLTDPTGEWPLCSGEFCSESGPFNNFEGYYGIRAELVAKPNECCDEAKIHFHWKETHALPPWDASRAGKSGCGEPANSEFEKKVLWPFSFGDIVKRGCSAPRPRHWKVGTCWVVQIDWECPVSCSGACPCLGNCEPSSSSMGIYPNLWRVDRFTQQGFSIRVDATIDFHEGSPCVLLGCDLSTKFDWRRRDGSVARTPANNCQQRAIDFLWGL